MLKKIAITVTAAAFLANTGYTCTPDGSKGIVPENDMNIPFNAKSTYNLDETQFNAVIDKVEAIYAPIISQAGAELNVMRNWEDGTVNAYASRSGNTWNVAMFGGLARHETVTPDGFALVVCHELGHHIGGAPKKSGWFGTWATNEGQADYFATLKCLRRVFRAEGNSNEVVAQMTVPASVVEACNDQWSDETDRMICQRGAMAGMSVSRLFQALRNSTTEPDFNTPDSNVVSRTNHNHPAYQCRLDTYYQGALCQVDELSDVDQDDAEVGTCNLATGDKVGNRPHCWYKAEENNDSWWPWKQQNASL